MCFHLSGFCYFTCSFTWQSKAEPDWSCSCRSHHQELFSLQSHQGHCASVLLKSWSCGWLCYKEFWESPPWRSFLFYCPHVNSSPLCCCFWHWAILTQWCHGWLHLALFWLAGAGSHRHPPTTTTTVPWASSGKSCKRGGRESLEQIKMRRSVFLWSQLNFAASSSWATLKQSGRTDCSSFDSLKPVISTRNHMLCTKIWGAS